MRVLSSLPTTQFNMQEQITLMTATILLEIINKKGTFALRVWALKINLPAYSPSHLMRKGFAS
jgi:hypothetical protein